MKAILLAASILGAASMAQGAIIYSASLSGPNESPANASPGTGIAFVTIDDVFNTMRVQVSFSGLTGTTNASHIHGATAVPGAGTAGVATTTPTFTGFPLGVTSGSMDQTYDMTQLGSFNPAYVTAHGGTAATAFTDLKAAIAGGSAYLNIHTSTFSGGEIRGFLGPIPEPSTGLLGLAGLGLALGRRRR